MQVVLDGARTDEQTGADLDVCESVAGQPRDLRLLGGQGAAGFDAAFADGLAGGQELASGAVGERFDAPPRQHLVGRAQLLASVDPPLLAS